jgi:hypothetical protein
LARARASESRIALGLLFEPFFVHLLATTREARHDVLAESLGGAPEIALVGAGLDLANDALPVLLVRVVPLNRRFELEAQPRVANLFSPERPQAPIDVFAHRQRFEPLDAHEILFVEGTQSLDAIFEVSDEPPDFLSVHGDVYVLSGTRALPP